MNILCNPLLIFFTLFSLAADATLKDDFCTEMLLDIPSFKVPSSKNIVTDIELDKLTQLALATPSLEHYSKVISCNGSTIAHYLAESKDIDWNTNDFSVLQLKDSYGHSVALLLAMHDKLQVTSEKVLTIRAEDGNTVAHVLAKKGTLKNFSKDILTMANDLGVLVVDNFVFNKDFNITDKDILMLRDKHGNTVYHYLANWRDDYQYYDEAILKLSNHFGNTVAHYLANNPTINWIPKNQDVLKWRNDSGQTVAHALARANKQFITHNMDILNLRDEFGLSVAGLMAIFNPNALPLDNKAILTIYDGNEPYSQAIAFYLVRSNPKFLPQDKDILQLRAGITGKTLAHALALENENWTTTDPSILELTDDFGNTVRDVLARRMK